MRKGIIALLAVMAIGVGLVGCKPAEEPAPADQDTEAPADTGMEEEAPAE